MDCGCITEQTNAGIPSKKSSPYENIIRKKSFCGANLSRTMRPTLGLAHFSVAQFSFVALDPPLSFGSTMALALIR